MEKMKGRVTRIISNQYTVENQNQTIVAVPAGKLRKKYAPKVGDIVEYIEEGGTFRIESISPRKNELLRPSIANVNQALIVTSCKDPDYSSKLLDRLIFQVSLADIEPVIILTKSDLCSREELEAIESDMALYEKAGYQVFRSHPGSNDHELKKLLENRISVLCGQSGAGKSSLLNRLAPDFKLKTQEISQALGRGKHTTRHCELHRVADGLVADTPGFSSLDLARMDLEHLDEHLKDFAPFLGKCRFKDCVHLKEPGCAIKEGVDSGQINPKLYEDYAWLMGEWKKLKKRY